MRSIGRDECFLKEFELTVNHAVNSDQRAREPFELNQEVFLGTDR